MMQFKELILKIFNILNNFCFYFKGIIILNVISYYVKLMLNINIEIRFLKDLFILENGNFLDYIQELKGDCIYFFG